MTKLADYLAHPGAGLPAPACALAGQRTPEQAASLTGAIAGAITCALLLSAVAAVREWRRSGLSFRDWLDSIR